ncbi:MAG: carboxypeptidase regulatory-like domain-containing protein [Burkholderiales bacterium]|nr:carboxypeptidase regulatory-like domain-containing protein [Burkholderiales bacterium]
MARYGMVVNLDRCIGCYNCQIACKDEHVGNDFPGVASAQPTFGQFWMALREDERMLSPTRIRVHYHPVMCQQCREAPCIEAAENGAAYRRPDGIVIFDPEKARGQEQIVSSCPYGVIYWNAEKNLPQKCTFCAHLLDDGWKEPRCVQTCPAGCLNFGDLDDPSSAASKLLVETGAEHWRPDYKAEPNVYYAGLPKPLLSGRVLFADRNEWAGEVAVTLTGAAGGERRSQTDCFGDFAFDRLAQGDYTVRFDAPGYATQSRAVRIGDGVCHLGDIALGK